MEKTFDELIEEVEYNFDNGNFVVSDTVHELMQQVREATIAECAEVAREHWTSPEIHINNLPTNSIKTDL